jgi:hypothetical protein
MEPEYDFTDTLREARESIESDHVQLFFNQVSGEGILTPQLSESQIHVSKDEAKEGIVFWARLFCLMRKLEESGLIQWIDFYTGEKIDVNWDFGHYFQKSRIAGSSEEPLKKTFPYLTRKGIEERWRDLYSVFKKASQSESVSASKYRRCLRLNLQNIRKGIDRDLSKSDRFAIIMVGDGSSISTMADFVVNNLLKEEDKDHLHSEKYIVRVGSSTHKIYPRGKSTKAKTAFHATPYLLEDHLDLMWNLYRKESIRSGVSESIKIDTKEEYRDEFLKNWEKVSYGGVES